MIDRFEIIGHDSPRPSAEHILFCDGTGGQIFRLATDLELSHWRPNCTPAEYRAGTSTEICYRFLDTPRPACWTVAVNNHVDVDGILSVYVLVQSDHASTPTAARSSKPPRWAISGVGASHPHNGCFRESRS